MQALASVTAKAVKTRTSPGTTIYSKIKSEVPCNKSVVSGNGNRKTKQEFNVVYAANFQKSRSHEAREVPNHQIFHITIRQYI